VKMEKVDLRDLLKLMYVEVRIDKESSLEYCGEGEYLNIERLGGKRK